MGGYGKQAEYQRADPEPTVIARPQALQQPGGGQRIEENREETTCYIHEIGFAGFLSALWV